MVAFAAPASDDSLMVSRFAMRPESSKTPRFSLRQARSKSGKGLIKLVVVIGCVSVLAVLAWAQTVTIRRHSLVFKCVQNLKEIDSAVLHYVQGYADDVAPRFLLPWPVPVSSAGNSEIAMSGDLSAMFRSLTNQLKGAELLRCPADIERRPESDFLKLANRNISYFITLEGEGPYPQLELGSWPIMFGDRNLAGGRLTKNRVMEITATNVVSWGSDIHIGRGNVALWDGSVNHLGNGGLKEEIAVQLKVIESGAEQAAHFAMP